MSVTELCANLEEDIDLLLYDNNPTNEERKIAEDIRQVLALLDERRKKLNPKFPYRIEKAIWYLMFLFHQGIITDDEYDRAELRLREKLK